MTPWEPALGLAAGATMLRIAAATLVSEDATCIAAGVLIASDRLDPAPSVIACLVGIVGGDLLLFLAGRWFGRPLLVRRPLRWLLSAPDVERASRWLRDHGAWVIFASRFTPGTRLPTCFAAGLLRTSMPRFAGYFTLAAALWTPLIVLGSAHLTRATGTAIAADAALLRPAVLLPLLCGAIGVMLALRLLLRLATHRGRRLLRGSIARLRHWEFWPPLVFYPPLAMYIAWLILRHRRPTLITAVNPAIPLGGLVGESKSAILDALAGTPERLPRHRLLRRHDSARCRRAQALAFVTRHGLGPPWVLKPDVGQRGQGVRVVHELCTLLEQVAAPVAGDLILQEYVPGVEFGLFWYRLPDRSCGVLSSITIKRLPVLIGDGRRTLEQLILDDPRAVAMAHVYRNHQADAAWRIPQPGERVTLTQLGSHCRGAIFADGDALRSEALEREVERVARGCAGFDYGRFDVRAASIAALREGRFTILELNGLTSEPTHVYDRRHGVLYAWRVMAAHWRVAFRIAAHRHARGSALPSLATVLAALLAWRRRGTDPQSAPGGNPGRVAASNQDAAGKRFAQSCG